MKTSIALLIMFTSFCSLFGYEKSLINFRVPSELTENSLEFTIQHRFGRYLAEKSNQNFFNGAVVNFGLRYQLPYGIEPFAFYGVEGDEFEIGTALNKKILSHWITGRLDISYFNYKIIDKAASNFFTSANIMTEPFIDRLALVQTVSYDNFHEYIGVGSAVIISPFDFIDFIGEYGYTHNTNKPFTKKYNPFSFGIKLNTYSHHFKITFSNTNSIDLRQAILGAESNRLRFGMSLQKQFEPFFE